MLPHPHAPLTPPPIPRNKRQHWRPACPHLLAGSQTAGGAHPLPAEGSAPQVATALFTLWYRGPGQPGRPASAEEVCRVLYLVQVEGPCRTEQADHELWSRDGLERPSQQLGHPPLPMALPVLGTDSSISCNLTTWALVDLRQRAEGVRSRKDGGRGRDIKGGGAHLGPEQYRSTRNLERLCRMGWLCRRMNCSRHTLWGEGLLQELGIRA